MITIGLMLSIAMSLCSQNKTYLTDEEKRWNPYKEGQVLIFESSSYKKDTVYIMDLDFGFPDGLGVVDYNESLYVLAESTGPDLGKHFSSSYAVLKIVAKTGNKPSYVEFGVELKNTRFVGGQRFYFEDLNDLAELSLTVPYGSFDDVIAIGNKNDYSNMPTAIELFYWSKSKGYIA